MSRNIFLYSFKVYIYQRKIKKKSVSDILVLLLCLSKLKHLLYSKRKKYFYTFAGYYEKIVGAFKNICQKLPVVDKYNTTLYVDGANGVGGKKLNIIKKTLDGELDLVLYNLGGNGGKLNLNVSFI